MSDFILKVYNFLKAHRFLRNFLLLFLTAVLVILSLRQKCSEDIFDFLPVEDDYRHAMQIYQKNSGADRIIGIFSLKDTSEFLPDEISEAIGSFEEVLEKNDKEKIVKNLVSSADLEKVNFLNDFVLDNIPFFLSDDDFFSFDSLFSAPFFVEDGVKSLKRSLSSGFMDVFSQNFQKDPLNLFSSKCQGFMQMTDGAALEIYDGRIFSSDMKFAIVTLTSPFGSGESGNNAKLLDLLENSANEALEKFPEVKVVFTGGPVIAVGNSSQIQSDTVLSVILSLILIMFLLIKQFKSLKNILLIVLSVAWGWLFAFGVLSLLTDGISIIVVGISSVILGIAVNYPLHFVAHLNHTPDIKTALKEIVMPLVVGNVTTVGAFLALVPAGAAALKDLGLFSALLLVGTIVFVLVFLPHFANVSGENHVKNFPDFSPEKNRGVVCAVLLLTAGLLFFSFGVKFDSDLSHINFMTETQKNALKQLQTMAVTTSSNEVYVVSSGADFDAAESFNSEILTIYDSLKTVGKLLEVSSCRNFLPSKTIQKHRLKLWQNFTQKYAAEIENRLIKAAENEGFAAGVFDDFFRILKADYQEKNIEKFLPLINSVFAKNVVIDTIKNECNIVDILKVNDDFDGKSLKKYAHVFDIKSLNSAASESLSDNFNYIGWVCGAIVFLFLWFSLGSLELALLSFLPMAVSWIWILGLMSLFDIQFNLVNVILATFIFGQGDDYTIFITEGCQWEYAYRRKMLSSYKESIIMSALIMFAGIGTLIFAKHPALFSLAQITVAGMFSVVFSAYIFPPLIFKFLVSKGGKLRKRPLSLKSIIVKDSSVKSWIKDCYRYKGLEIYYSVKKRLKTYGDFSFNSDVVFFKNSKAGEVCLLAALKNPQIRVFGFEEDPDNLVVAKIVAETVDAKNVEFLPMAEFEKIREKYPAAEVKIL
ncbi:MAG: MMPL family transporter [Bacteroidales bacterium]|nr:MMPL family transporter [Bacteroidales bacterium]